MIVNESFKKGFLTGLSMNPLYAGEGGIPPEPEKLKPVVRLELNGNLDNTGTDDSFTVSTNGVPITYEEGLNGKQCYSAKVINEIRVNGDFASLFNNECTLICFVKCEQLSSTSLNRRILYTPHSSGYTLIAELRKSTTAGQNGLAELSFGGTGYYYGMSNINNNEWVCLAVLIKKGMLTLWQSDSDTTTGVSNANTVKTPTAAYIALSHYNSSSSSAYYLRGCIQDFRVYDKCLSYDELKEIAKEGGL